MLIYAFPGQGSQKKGMGSHLFPKYASLMEKADTILGYSMQQLCLEDKERQLSNTLFTQPALYVVNALHYYERLALTDVSPDYLIGHSLGEFNALLAAGVFDFETGLLLVKKRAELMSNAKKGRMAAIIGASLSTIHEILENASFPNITIANLNAPQQYIISGPEDDLMQCQHAFQGDVKFVPLNVSGAFHSPLMEEAGIEFSSYIKQFSLSPARIKVISNYTARPYTADSLYENLCKQITSPVRWMDSIQYLLKQGPMLLEETGPGNVLSKLAEQIAQCRLN
ncbi:ACP S-malonyltransferase [Nibrella saemangeumensis]|uniref:Malonyl CoA-acyl carrier protein transacylase n=1 Tax=Nibrella saemangeumensis TaxID=1084526 RepID=A0ABP8NB66_9BACT